MQRPRRRPRREKDTLSPAVPRRPALPRLFLLAALLVAAACDTAADSPEAAPVDVDVSQLSHDPAGLVGTWDLRSVTSSGFGSPPATTAAADLDWSEAYTFRADGTVDVSRDGVLEERTVYVVETLPVAASPLLRIGGEDRYRRLYFGVTRDRLYIDHRPADGPLVEYARR